MPPKVYAFYSHHRHLPTLLNKGFDVAAENLLDLYAAGALTQYQSLSLNTCMIVCFYGWLSKREKLWKSIHKMHPCQNKSGDARRPPKQTWLVCGKIYLSKHYNRWTTVLFSFVFHFSTNLNPTFFICICWCSFEQSFEGSGTGSVYFDLPICTKYIYIVLIFMHENMFLL